MAKKQPLYPHVPKSKATFKPTNAMFSATAANIHIHKAIEELDIAGKLLPSGRRFDQVAALFGRADDILNHIKEDLKDISEGVPFRHG